MTDKMKPIVSDEISKISKANTIEIAQQIATCLACPIDAGWVINGVVNINTWKSRFYKELKKANEKRRISEMKFSISSSENEDGRTFTLNVIRIK